MPIRVLFVLLVFVLFTVSSRAAEKPFVINAFAVKSTALPKGSIGVLRHFCFESVQFLAYGSSKGAVDLLPISDDLGVPLSCDGEKYRLLSEHLVTSKKLKKGESALARKITIDGRHFLLLTSRQGHASLKQYQ